MDLDAIRQILRDPRYPTRVAISRAVCEALDWRKPDGGLKEVSCRVALVRMQADGLLELPAPGRPVPRFRLSAVPSMLAMPGPEIVGTRGDLGEITLQRVRSKGESRLWNELIARYHYLGYCPLTGAQLRYFATAGGRLLAAMGFGAAACEDRAVVSLRRVRVKLIDRTGRRHRYPKSPRRCRRGR